MKALVRLPWPPRALWPNGGRGHHFAVHRAAKKYLDECAWHMLGHRKALERAEGPVHVTFHPKDRGPVPDRDNCISGFKYGQDALANVMGINDRDLNDRISHAIGDRVKGGCVMVEVGE